MEYECANPGCRKRTGVEVHHIVPLAEGGVDKPANLICLCRNCHHPGNKHTEWILWVNELTSWKWTQEQVFAGKGIPTSTRGIPPKKLPDLVFTVNEVAGMLRVSNMSIYRLFTNGNLLPVKVGKSYRITEKEFRRCFGIEPGAGLVADGE
jgi:excisionase family DNA binding protein